jgi:hypothetical protein
MPTGKLGGVVVALREPVEGDKCANRKLAGVGAAS